MTFDSRAEADTAKNALQVSFPFRFGLMLPNNKCIAFQFLPILRGINVGSRGSPISTRVDRFQKLYFRFHLQSFIILFFYFSFE